MLTLGYTSVNRNNYVAFELNDVRRDVLVSKITRLRSTRFHTPMPAPPDALQIYDNGDAQMYHLRPGTPFQR
jgi:hypothetical protein